MSRRRKIWVAVGSILGLVILVPIIHHYQLRFALESYIAELKAKGEPMELEKVIPSPVPPEQNGASLITNALANLKYESVAGSNAPPAMRMIGPGKAMIGWQQSDICGFKETNRWEDLGRELTAATGDLNAFQSLTNHPLFDFNVKYQPPFEFQLPWLPTLKRSAQWLSASALYDLHQNNSRNACAEARAMIALIKGETEERTLISQLVRIAITAMSAGVTWEVLQAPQVADEDLAGMQQDWESLDFTKSLEKALIFERVEYMQEFEQARASSKKFNGLWGNFYTTNMGDGHDDSNFMGQTKRSAFLRKCDEFRWHWFWSYADEKAGMQALQVLIEATRRAETYESLQSVESFANAKLSQLDQGHDGENDLRGLFSAGAMNSAMRKVIKIETAKNVVVTAIALKRYELRHDKLPATLDELTPDLLKAIPIDCMDGQPLRYKPKADGTYLLHSVGANGVDDGGNPALEKYVTGSNYNWQNDHALDWVWPQPATAEEIQKYYAEQAKKAE
jgi:hypothetical protein